MALKLVSCVTYDMTYIGSVVKGYECKNTFYCSN